MKFMEIKFAKQEKKDDTETSQKLVIILHPKQFISLHRHNHSPTTPIPITHFLTIHPSHLATCPGEDVGPLLKHPATHLTWAGGQQLHMNPWEERNVWDRG